MKQETLRKEAKEIMDNFMKELENVTVRGEFFVRRTQNIREKKAPVDKEFADRMLENAPQTTQRWVQAEKKKW
jgi:hypothetical protein